MEAQLADNEQGLVRFQDFRLTRPRGLAAVTPGPQPGNAGSIPAGGMKQLAVGELGHPAGFGRRRSLVRLQPARLRRDACRRCRLCRRRPQTPSTVTDRSRHGSRSEPDFERLSAVEELAVLASLMSSRSWVRIPPARCGDVAQRPELSLVERTVAGSSPVVPVVVAVV